MQDCTVTANPGTFNELADHSNPFNNHTCHMQVGPHCMHSKNVTICMMSFPFVPPFLLSKIPIVIFGSIGKSVANVPPLRKMTCEDNSNLTAGGKQSFYLTEIGQLAANRVKHFSASSRGYGWGSEKRRRDLDFAHLRHAMIFNYPMEGVFYWATQLHTVTCPL